MIVGENTGVFMKKYDAAPYTPSKKESEKDGF